MQIKSTQLLANCHTFPLQLCDICDLQYDHVLPWKPDGQKLYMQLV